MIAAELALDRRDNHAAGWEQLEAKSLPSEEAPRHYAGRETTTE